MWQNILKLIMTRDGESVCEETHMTSDNCILMSLPLMEGSEVSMSGMKSLDDEDLEDMVKVEDDDDDVNQMLSVVNGGDVIQNNHSTLQSLLSTPVSSGFTAPEGMQVVTAQEFLNLGLATEGGEGLVHIVPTNTSLGTKYIGLIAIANPSLLANGKQLGFSGFETADSSDLHSATVEGMAAILMPPPQEVLPVNCPAWAMRLKKCEKIGDSYRGYVETETELDMVLTQHKQQTSSFWGTRQSPSPAKTSTRLMWKSQYVPFDGIPFVNTGSRAVVMECQFGPRRRGTLGKRGSSQNSSGEFKQTCPARIYIKKVRKFPSHSVNLNLDKKSIRLAMDKAFHELREQGLDRWGEERYYVQLPTLKAHDYHECKQDSSSSLILEETMNVGDEQNLGARIHPSVLEKLRQMVAGGETRLYYIRKQLRRFVLKELFQCPGSVPERHDLTMFPTVNDLKNHIHQAMKDIESGLLPLTTCVASVESMQVSESNAEDQDSSDNKHELCSLWANGSLSSGAMPETVTVTLTQNPEQDGHHIISRIETHLSDGTTQVSTTLTPETAQLLSRLHPGLFPAGSLLQIDTCNNSSANGAADSIQENPVSDVSSDLVDGDGTHTILDSLDSSQNISGLIDTDPTDLSSIVHSQPDLNTLTGASLSVLRSVHTATISELVSSGAAGISIVTGLPNTLAIVTCKSDTAGTMAFDSSDSDSNQLTLVENDDHHGKLTEQELGMARLEHRVSDL
ncbi:calcium-responsive transcription factor-like isoform X2 [Biomphalaria glabrata]|uniref:Calcium-responsive transcription factor-like isoform X2 n=1 Tax=Biomphalaria glabrata TaxID=6526 RepID=A0A9W3AMF1_BIOGL|nr:calcium-responsive transcription factor-like isoform X2 [Biomphalaria glabrata]XP_055888421.1 calcium-responsive transcription factor-like isoform X2 [Biomphalaria glabrata]